MYIQQYLQWNGREIERDSALLFRSEEEGSLNICTDIYRMTGMGYAKFFKMDLLSKVAFMAASLVLPKEVAADKNKVAVVLSSVSGCLDVDKKFDESRAAIASPGLFVYTLPNIMLGEICIANGFKGEQMCSLSSGADADWFEFYVTDLFQKRGAEAVLCGHVEATETGITAALLWVTQQPSSLSFNQQNLERIFSKIK